MTVVVYSKDDPKAVPPILDELAARLNRQPKLFRSVFYKIDVAKLKSKGLYNDQVSLQTLETDQRFPRPVAGPAAGRPRLAECGRPDRLVRPADRSAETPRSASWTDTRSRSGCRPGTAEQVAGGSSPAALSGARCSGQYQSPFPEMSALLAMQGDRLGSGYKLLKRRSRWWHCWRLYLVKNEKTGSFAEYSDGLDRTAADRQRHEEPAPRGLGRLDGPPRHGKRRDGVEPDGHGPGRRALVRRRRPCSTSPASAACGIP